MQFRPAVDKTNKFAFVKHNLIYRYPEFFHKKQLKKNNKPESLNDKTEEILPMTDPFMATLAFSLIVRSVNFFILPCLYYLLS
jgi:hypothetical protein